MSYPSWRQVCANLIDEEFYTRVLRRQDEQQVRDTTAWAAAMAVLHVPEAWWYERNVGHLVCVQSVLRGRVYFETTIGDIGRFVYWWWKLEGNRLGPDEATMLFKDTENVMRLMFEAHAMEP